MPLDPKQTELAKAVFDSLLSATRVLTKLEQLQLGAAFKGYASFDQLSDGVRRHLANVGLAAFDVLVPK